ncbi:hypothetical protein Zmor_008460 [Zophobas morio]|uniref:Uncharacterized protein n=1 Tax=Zophobas morio TaxID=2755281 RepID=A0AA38IYU6_9CUCU|nr:hypothetical protein Zmor_008460 [Zophobas morio]
MERTEFLLQWRPAGGRGCGRGDDALTTEWEVQMEINQEWQQRAVRVIKCIYCGDRFGLCWNCCGLGVSHCGLDNTPRLFFAKVDD